MTKNIIKQSRIFLSADVSTFEEAVILAGNQYLAEGMVKETYMEAVIAREQVYPTGLAANGFNIAIPHTDAVHVNQSGIAVIVPKKEIQVAMMGNPEQMLSCQLIFPLAMESPEGQLEMLMELMAFFQNQELLTSIYNAKNEQAVFNLLGELNT